MTFQSKNTCNGLVHGLPDLSNCKSSLQLLVHVVILSDCIFVHVTIIQQFGIWALSVQVLVGLIT